MIMEKQQQNGPLLIVCTSNNYDSAYKQLVYFLLIMYILISYCYISDLKVMI